MKKQSKTTIVHRIDLEKGKYTTLSRNILINPNLRDSSKTLIQLLLNNVEGWILVLSYYQKQLGWSNDKMAGAVADLIQNGYLKKNKYSKGKDKGFYYTYVISEFGNLNPNKEQVSEEDIISCINEETEEAITEAIPADENSIQPESNQQPEPIESQVVIPEVKVQPFVVDNEFWDMVFGVLTEELQGMNDITFAQKVVDYYSNQMETGKLTAGNYDEQALRKVLRDRATSKKKAALDELSKLIELFNDKGTKDQKAVIKLKALDYFEDFINNGTEITRADVSLRMLKLKQSVVEANRNLDQRYQN